MLLLYIIDTMLPAFIPGNQTPGQLDWMDILAFSAIITSVLTASMLVWKVLKRPVNAIIKFFHFIEEFKRSWFGEPETPNRPAEPGVLQRLNDIDGEFKPNGGGSLKDSVNRIERNFEKIQDELGKLKSFHEEEHKDIQSKYDEVSERQKQMLADIELIKEGATNGCTRP